VIAALGLCFAALTALTWRKWGVPEIDAGAELTTADLIRHGAVAYQDVRYYYGPLGLYSLALSFKLFGTSFTTAYAFGLAQAAAILAAFYALARHWLVPLSAGLATAVLLAIGFSGTSFNFVLPHTDSATFESLCLLLMLLRAHPRAARAGGRGRRAGRLTRPEFLAVAAGGVARQCSPPGGSTGARRRGAPPGAWRCRRS
jgi:4-amino-4-deoxy-L-arabinose transferase-like glycosyltransferase